MHQYLASSTRVRKYATVLNKLLFLKSVLTFINVTMLVVLVYLRLSMARGQSELRSRQRQLMHNLQPHSSSRMEGYVAQFELRAKHYPVAQMM